MFGKSLPNKILSPSARILASSSRGNGIVSSANGVKTIVVSNRTRSTRAAMSMNAGYSGMPMCAIPSGNRGRRCSRDRIGSGPVKRPGRGRSG
jgi:hypothetical protein